MEIAQVLTFLSTCGHHSKTLRRSQHSLGTTENCRAMGLASAGSRPFWIKSVKISL